MTNFHLPAMLVIMDGYGVAEAGPANAISRAQTPNLDALLSTCPHILLDASGEAVGLPDGQMGNSEVGHLNIGAGRVVYQELTRINKAFREGLLADNRAINDAIGSVLSRGSVLHIMGLLSDGGVHSSDEHLFALIEHALASDVQSIRIHCFMDGRDVPPSSGASYMAKLQSFIRSEHAEDRVRIASVSGRYFAMDRDKRWDRVERAYDAIVSADPCVTAEPLQVIDESYAAGITDEFIEPVAFDARGIEDGDAVIFFNFRPDRAREITRAIVDPDFDGFERKTTVDVSFVCLTEYDPLIDAPVAFPKQFPDNVLADVLAHEGLSQYRIAETEKYAHVTFFFNGGIEEPKAGEQRVLIASPKVATYDLQPSMSEPEVASTLAAAIEADAADVYIVNFANCDMVGHTGSADAAIQAVEAVDEGVGLVIEAIRSKNGFALVTADHGNADKMFAADGSPHTAHTTAPVPLILVDATGQNLEFKADHGALCDIAPTLLAAIGIEIPEEFSGRNLLS